MKRLALAALALLMTTGIVAQTAPQRTQSLRVVPVPESDLDVRIWTPENDYRVGENVQIYYRASRDAYVLIFSTAPDGETRQLLPNAYDDNNYVRGGQTYSIPNSGYRLEVTPPTGRETLSIVAFSERSRALDAYRTRKSEVFPKSDGPRAAISRIIVRPDDDDEDRRYAQDSTTIRIRERGRDNNDRWNDTDRDNRWDRGDRSDDRDRWDNDRRDQDRRGYGRLSIESDPGAAYVYIGGQYRGITPMNLGQVRAGTYDIVLNRAGYYPVRKRVRVEDGERERVDENLRLIQY